MPDLPEFIGSYRILHLLGKGGFATVYLAFPRHLDEKHPVAVKVLDSQEGYGRFQREIEMIARLSHPNIVQILDSGEDEKTGNPFFVMEYITGGTLCERLTANGPLPRREAIELIGQIGAALNYAHEQGIIHRDVKPQNILLDTTRNPLRPVLADFGLAKTLLPEDPHLTKTVALIGSFAYYAPEQWNRAPLTPQTDLYALALTFFEMVAGRRPFEGDIFSLRDQHLHSPLPSLSSLAAPVGPFFDRVLSQGAAKRPGDRYPSMTAFLEALAAANDRAEQAERTARQKRAGAVVEMVRERIEQGDYNPEQMSLLLNAALKDHPESGEALRLRGRLRLELRQVPAALEDFRQAYELENPPSVETSLDYARALQQAVEWGTPAEALHWCRTVREKRETAPPGGQRTAWQTAWMNLIQNCYKTGLQAYSGGNPEDPAEAVGVINQAVERLATLGAGPELQELQELQEKMRWLQLKQSEETLYAEIQHLIHQGDFARALEYLDNGFIRPGNYGYRDVARLFYGLVYARQSGQLPAEWPRAVEQPPEQPGLKTLAQQHEINRYIIPVSLGLALLAGSIIGPELPGLFRQSIFSIIALVCLVVYLAYYVWIYYLSQSYRK